jgi:uncharacterized membrane protein YdbT with pleckstrin-like domain
MWRVFVLFLLDTLAVPPEPSPPHGSAGTLTVFRAAPAYYRYRLVLWALRHVPMLALVLGSFAIVEIALREDHANAIAFTVARTIEVFVLSIWSIALLVGYALQRLDYEMRWYMVTDRSLRIREGVLVVREMTLTFANVQNVTIDQGPLQRMLGVADVRVQTAGGGAGHQQVGESMHTGVLRGITDAEKVRELVLGRMREAGGAGLGDPDEKRRPAATLDDACSTLLAEARALGAAARRLAR